VLIHQVRLIACPDVTAFVSVLDENDTPIPRLNVGNLRCTEDGNPVRCTIQNPATEPLSAVIVLGLNGLTAVDAEVARAAARILVNSMSAGDRVAIIHMETAVNPILPFTSDRAALLNAIDAMREVGTGNALFDAVALAGSLAAQERDRRQVVFLLTPNDNSGGAIATADAAMSRVNAAGVTYFAAGFGPGAPNVPLANFLRRLARETSGRTTIETRISDIQQRMRDYWRLLANQYALSYTSGIAPQNRLFGVNFAMPGQSASAVRSYAGCR
jgi:VWFA-related protein